MAQHNTVQRRQVLDAVRQLQNHPTAEDVYVHLQKQDSGLGRATVYRNLNVLCGQGLLRCIPVSDAPNRFDHTLESHQHLRCRSCGAFCDVDIPGDIRMDKAVAKQTGFAQVTHDIVFTGVCAGCAALSGE